MYPATKQTHLPSLLLPPLSSSAHVHYTGSKANSNSTVKWEAVAVQAGLKNKAVAVESYRQLQKKLGWSTGTSSAKSPAKVSVLLLHP